MSADFEALLLVGGLCARSHYHFNDSTKGFRQMRSSSNYHH